MAVKPIPDGYHSVTPYLTVSDATLLFEFVKDVFHATEKERIVDENGRVRHAEAIIGDSVVMMGQASDQWTARPSTLYVYVDDTDATYQRALDAGAEVLQEPRDTYYGDRNAGVTDPVGNQWWLATHVEDVTKEEIQRRALAQGK